MVTSISIVKPVLAKHLKMSLELASACGVECPSRSLEDEQGFIRLNITGTISSVLTFVGEFHFRAGWIARSDWGEGDTPALLDGEKVWSAMKEKYPVAQ